MIIIYEDIKFSIIEHDKYYVLYTNPDPNGWHDATQVVESKTILGLVKLCKKAGLI